MGCRQGDNYDIAWAEHPPGAKIQARLVTMNLAIDAADVRAAAERIRPLARRTPVMTSAGFDAAAGARVFFKCENLQREARSRFAALRT